VVEKVLELTTPLSPKETQLPILVAAAAAVMAVFQTELVVMEALE
jgi:hypothetical protein